MNTHYESVISSCLELCESSRFFFPLPFFSFPEVAHVDYLLPYMYILLDKFKLDIT